MMRLLSMAAALALLSTACSSPSQTLQSSPSQSTLSLRAQEMTQSFEAQGQNVSVLDLGQGKQTNAAIAFSFQAEEGFKTLASENGGVGKALADVSQFGVFLFDCTAAPPTTALTAPSTHDLATTPCSQVFDGLVATTGSPQTIIFDNVGTSTGQYYVGVSALEGAGPYTNITRYTTGSMYSSSAATTAEHGKLMAVSTSGVGVDGSFAVSTTTPLAITLPLLDAKGAKIESSVTVSDGNASLSGGITVQ